jgi:hypothetical protein
MTSLRRACGVSSFGRLPVPCPPAPAAFFLEADHVYAEIHEVEGVTALGR